MLTLVYFVGTRSTNSVYKDLVYRILLSNIKNVHWQILSYIALLICRSCVLLLSSCSPARARLRLAPVSLKRLTPLEMESSIYFPQLPKIIYEVKSECHEPERAPREKSYLSTSSRSWQTPAMVPSLTDLLVWFLPFQLKTTGTDSCYKGHQRTLQSAAEGNSPLSPFRPPNSWGDPKVASFVSCLSPPRVEDGRTCTRIANIRSNEAERNPQVCTWPRSA